MSKTNILRRAIGFVGVCMGIGLMAVTPVRGEASCWECVWHDVTIGFWTCDQTLPPGGYHNCLVSAGVCTLSGGPCAHTIASQVDVDGRIVVGVETIVEAVLRTTTAQEAPGTLQELILDLDGDWIRNCAGEAIARVQGEGVAPPPGDLIL